MQFHLDEISLVVAKGAHAVLLLDRAGWHTTGNLITPKNITLVFLPSRAPELNPVENIWQYLRHNWQTASSTPTRPSSKLPAKPGASSSPNPTPSPQSACETGPAWIKDEGRWYHPIPAIGEAISRGRLRGD
jgi:hypothetical protein